MRPPTWFYVGVCAFWLLVGIGIREHMQHARELDALITERTQLRHLGEMLRDSLSESKTQLRRDTIRLVNTERVYKTIRDTLKLTDTVSVKAAFVAADSTIVGCHAALLSCTTALRLCEAKCANDSSEWEVKLHIAESKIPSKMSRFLSATKWVAIGLGTGYIAARISR